MGGSKLAFTVWTCVIGIWGLASIAHFVGIRINHTPSLPVGIWRVSPPGVALTRGHIVTFCAPQTEVFRHAFRMKILGHGHCPGGWEAMLKSVAAVEGDRIKVKPSGLEINGTLVPGTTRLALQTEAIPFGSYTVGQDEIWVIANAHPRSFDSRYFGPIPLGQVEGTAEPLLIWSSDAPSR